MEKFLEKKFSHLGAFVESSGIHTQDLLSLSQILHQKASPSINGPVKEEKISSRHRYHFKRQVMAASSVGPIDTHLPHLDVHIEDIRE